MDGSGPRLEIERGWALGVSNQLALAPIIRRMSKGTEQSLSEFLFGDGEEAGAGERAEAALSLEDRLAHEEDVPLGDLESPNEEDIVFLGSGGAPSEPAANEDSLPSAAELTQGLDTLLTG